MRSRCGICNVPFEASDEFYLIVRARNPASLVYCQGPFPFESHRYFRWAGKGSYYIRSYIPSFAGIDESCAVHCDCIEIVTGRYELIDRTVLTKIWTLAAWRAPWREAAEENFEQAVAIPNRAVLRTLGICDISRLPTEIAEMVMEYARSSLLSSYSTAAEFANMIQTLPDDEIQSIPFRHILSWSRGSSLVRCAGSEPPIPIVRITVDAYGIRAVERLYEYPKFLTKRISNCLFVILSITELGSTVAHIRYNRMRLHLRIRGSGLQTWDTPNPPAIMRCTVLPDRIYYGTHFKTIYPSQISGITFFFIQGCLERIHAHSTSEPFAVEAFRRQWHTQCGDTAWIYLPISHNDSIVSIYSRKYTNPECQCITTLFFELKLVGTVAIGISYQAGTNVPLATSSPLALIYNCESSQKVNVFGAYVGDGENATKSKQPEDSSSHTPPFHMPATFQGLH